MTKPRNIVAEPPTPRMLSLSPEDSMRTSPIETFRVAATPAARPTAQAAPFGALVASPTPPTPPAHAAADALQREVATIQRQESAIDRLIAGGDTSGLSNGELLRLQATMYSYSQRVDVATRVIDRAAGGLRQLLTIQV